MHHKAILFLLCIVASIPFLTELSSSPQPLSPLAENFLRETQSGINVGLPRGLDEGLIITLKDGKAVSSYIDGGSSDGRLLPGTDSGTYRISENKLTLYVDGTDEGIVFEFTEPTAELVEHGVRYTLVGQEMTFGWAPIPWPLPNAEPLERPR